MLYGVVVEVVASYNYNTGVDVAWQFFAFECVNSAEYAVVAHAEWVLHYQSIDVTFLESVNFFWVGVESNQYQIVAEVALSNGPGNANAGMVVVCEEAYQVRCAGDNVFCCSQGGWNVVVNVANWENFQARSDFASLVVKPLSRLVSTCTPAMAEMRPTLPSKGLPICFRRSTNSSAAMPPPTTLSVARKVL